MEALSCADMVDTLVVGIMNAIGEDAAPIGGGSSCSLFHEMNWRSSNIVLIPT